MPEAARWYLALTLMGAGGLLPAYLLFGGLRSAGVLYARPLALLLVALGAWLLSAVLRVPYALPLVLAMVLALWVWSAAIAWTHRDALAALRSRTTLIVVGEVVFIALFALAVLVRAQAPNATDTEKPMDLMLLASVGNARTLPPEDAWFAGHPVAYYHLGHVMVDAAARIAGVSTGVAFTFGVATAAALAGVAAFALAGDVLGLSTVRRRSTPYVAGVTAVTSLLLLAPIEGLFELLAAHGVGSEGQWQRLGVQGLPGPALIETGVPTQFWWWWRATRVIPDTITEFPAFSVILGDLHAHVLALPLAMLALATVLPAFEGRHALTWTAWIRSPAALALSAAIFAGLALTNSWDAGIYGAIWGLAAIAAAMGTGWPPLGALMLGARYLLLPAALALLMAAPFFASLDSLPLGLALVTDRGSDPVHFAIVWVPLVLPLIATAVLVRPSFSADAALIAGAVGSALVLSWAAALFIAGDAEALAARGAGWVTLGVLIATLSVSAAASAAALQERDTARAAWLGLVATAALIVLLTELVFIEDAFRHRMNTVFKFWYACWVLLAIAGGAAVAMALDRREALLAGLRPAAAVLPLLAAFAVLYVGSLLYAPAATVARAREGQEQGIDALAYLDRVDPGAAEALRWIREHLGPGDLLLEAVGDDYGPGNVISAASGAPTLLGWPGHQLQWRGNIPALSGRRFAVDDIYRAGAGEEARALAQQHGVTHVYIGREERRQYGEDVAERFASWPVAFEAEDVRIVAVPGTDSSR